jgi:hypothetical protein
MMAQQTESTANTGGTGNATDDTRASAVEESSSLDEPSSDEHGREHYSR